MTIEDITAEVAKPVRRELINSPAGECASNQRTLRPLPSAIKSSAPKAAASNCGAAGVAFGAQAERFLFPRNARDATFRTLTERRGWHSTHMTHVEGVSQTHG